MVIEEPRVCFVAMDNYSRVPYLAHYLECIDVPFDFIYWNRANQSDSVGAARMFSYNMPAVGLGLEGKLKKLRGYIGFRRFARSLLKENDYERVVLLTGNCAVLLGDVLLKNYSGRYSIDIRDYWHEDFAPYHNYEQKLITHAAFTVISSPAYRKFLGEHDFKVMHNSQILSCHDIESLRHDPGSPIVIGTIGAAKNIEYDKKTIQYFANDDRFELRFIGLGYEVLSSYCERYSIKNVVAKGAFPVSETIAQYQDVDVILNMYGNHSPYWDYALSNKLYFAAQLGIPILACPDTAVAEISESYDFGYAIDLEDQTHKDRIAEAFLAEQSEKRSNGQKLFLTEVDRENVATKQCISDFLSLAQEVA